MAERGSWRKRREEEVGVGGETILAQAGISKERLSYVSSEGSSSKSVLTTNMPNPQSNSPKILQPNSSSTPFQQQQQQQRPMRKSNPEDTGPAAPLQPLHISAGRPLPHPALYSGSDNWAFTPNDNLPSLPATPSRAMHVLGWQRASTPAAGSDGGTGEQARSGMGQGQTPSREKPNNLSARAVLNKRMEDQRNYSPSPVRNQRPSPKVGLASLGSPSSTTSRISNLGSPIDVPITMAGGSTNSIAAVLNKVNNSTLDSATPGMIPPLHHRDSLQSIASSTNNSLGQHVLSHSRRPSQIFNASPAISNATVSSGFRPAPPYRVYRPPHLRTDSYFGLQPKVAHYDRVSAPMLRGQSRSPSVSRSRAESVSISRTTSESNFSSSSPRMGNRRLSNLSNQQTILQNQQNITGQTHTLDSNSLIAKLANAKLDLSGRTRGTSPFFGDSTSSTAQDQEVLEDVDLTVEDMMMSGTLTDQYYHSRTASISSAQAPFIDIFEIGDRLGPKMMHDGHEITIAETSDGFNAQSGDWTGTQLEIVSKLGEGSYAVVYLVKEVPRLEDGHRQIAVTPVTASMKYHREPLEFEQDQSIADETILQSGDLYGTTIKASASGRLADENQERNLPKLPSNSEERYFALKCLCKRDLSDEMLEVQRLESTIHQSIPYHPNIVTLYRTYETPEWLFLVLEYCPGQDLFYWLEQAQDTENLGANTPGGNSDGSEADLTAIDATPPSPSLLASTESEYLLSRRRLRLISRMFQQICEAVGFCHERGISHRDIKPENFIVEDTRGDESLRGGEESEEKNLGGVKVKLTDFGLAVAQSRCIDFDCGSKPYMSYECRNNTLRWYNPIESDIWSLGIVLLNLIFHRNPFMEPNAERCPSFASYVQDPERFLTTAFRGLKPEAAQFLSERVFCDVTEGDESQRRHRISARDLGEWASNLAEHLEAPEIKKRTEFLLSPSSLDGFSAAGADHGITSPLWHSRSPASSIVNSLMASPASNTRSINIYQELATMGISEEEVDNFTPLFSDAMKSKEDEGFKEVEKQANSSSNQERDEVGKNMDRIEVKDKQLTDSVGHNQITNGSSTDSTETDGKGLNEDIQDDEVEESIDDDDAKEEKEEILDESSEMDNASILSPPSVTSTSGNPKRRKRGARKGRTLAKQQLKRSRSVENLQSETQMKSSQSTRKDGQIDFARDQTIRELAEASQLLAREMSKKTMQQKGSIVSVSDRASTKEVSNLGLPISPSLHRVAPPSLSIDLKELQNRVPQPDSSNSDGATTTFSSLNSVSRGSTTSRASSQFTNYDWSESRKSGTMNNPVLTIDQLPQSSLTNNNPQSGSNVHGSALSANNGKLVLQDSGRTRLMQHPSSTAADWRERNTSNASLASISSINTLNSYTSDVGSIRSTASAPPAMITQYYRRVPGSMQTGQTTSNSSVSSSSRNPGLPSMRSGSNVGVGSGDRNSIGSRNMLAAGGRNLGTINERSSGAGQNSRSGQQQKDLDASYLAGIFGGRAPQQRSRNQYYDHKTGAPPPANRFGSGQKENVEVLSDKISPTPIDRQQSFDIVRGSSTDLSSGGAGSGAEDRSRSVKTNASTTSLDHIGASRPSSTSEAESNRDLTHSVPRKKMLGKFLQGVKNYNRGVKAAPAMHSDEHDLANADGNI